MMMTTTIVMADIIFMFRTGTCRPQENAVSGIPAPRPVINHRQETAVRSAVEFRVAAI